MDIDLSKPFDNVDNGKEEKAKGGTVTVFARFLVFFFFLLLMYFFEQ